MKKIFNKKHAGFSRILLPLFCFLISTLAFGQVPPSPLLINCPNPGLGFNNFPATVSIDNQPVSITKTINTAVYSMSPSSSKCGLTIKPGALLFFPAQERLEDPLLSHSVSRSVMYRLHLFRRIAWRVTSLQLVPIIAIHPLLRF